MKMIRGIVNYLALIDVDSYMSTYVIKNNGESMHITNIGYLVTWMIFFIMKEETSSA